MLFAVIESPGGGRIAVANLHASFHTPKAATRDVEVAAGRAAEWAAGLPLIFGGDLNLRPRTSPEAFAELERRHGLERRHRRRPRSTTSSSAAWSPLALPESSPPRGARRNPATACSSAFPTTRRWSREFRGFPTPGER